MGRARPRTWKDLPLVEVVWEDAAIDTSHEAALDDTEGLKGFGGRVLCRDVGYLVSKDRSEVRLAVGVICEGNSVRHSNTIIRGWVREIIPLTRGRETEARSSEADNQLHHSDERAANATKPDCNPAE